MPERLRGTIGGQEQVLAARTSIGKMLRSRAFWRQRSPHPVARLFLILVVAVLLAIAIGFIVASGKFTRHDLLAVTFYLGLAAFAWHPMTAAFMVMLISSVGVVFAGSGGDLLELAVAVSLVAATCGPSVIIAYVTLLGLLTTYLVVSGPTLAEGGVYGIAGIAAIAFLAGVAFRLVAARETVLVAERARVTKVLEAIAKEDQERIADELHDGIAHDLTLILFHARALPRQPDDAARQVSLTTIEGSAERALQSIQSLLSLMRDTTPEGLRTHSARYDGNILDVVSSLGSLLKDAGIPTVVSTPNIPLNVAPVAERVLTESAIEAVTNIIKHAPKSQSASIEVRGHPDNIGLIVRNTATANPTSGEGATGGRGLKRARQRLAQQGGILEAGQASDGWTLLATVPVEGTKGP
ncbi:signal transduction histidine kinase [Microbacterium resistens]|uniref:histidine kinase n=1 Tax=Microbacterium resistens TaxID=156977 RepID=A0ABU1SCV1_9MICO|nr:histidine kinase [Microbacterium resistens]MDR6867420.1 signal transduction histidine kinase [Microbacterium resistens]